MRAEDYWGISMFKAWFATPLWARVLLALILGAVTGYLWGPGAESIKIVGDLLIDFIKMLIVPLIFLLFIIPGAIYGYVAGTVKSHRDLVQGMSKSMSTMSYYLVMIFFCAQFTAAFGRSNLGAQLAVKGADFLKFLGLSGSMTIVGISDGSRP